MAIVIKEITVKTTIVRNSAPSALSKETVAQLKREILSELNFIRLKQNNKRKER